MQSYPQKPVQGNLCRIVVKSRFTRDNNSSTGKAVGVAF